MTTMQTRLEQIYTLIYIEHHATAASQHIGKGYVLTCLSSFFTFWRPATHDSLYFVELKWVVAMLLPLRLSRMVTLGTILTPVWSFDF